MAKAPYDNAEAEGLNVTINETDCCAMSTVEGVGRVESAQDARNLRRTAFQRNNSGYVIATCVLPGHKKQVTYLKRGGWKQLAQVKNPNTERTIIIMGAHTYTAKHVESEGYWGW